MTGILGKKIGMSRIIDENGNFVAVTYVNVTPNEVVQIKNIEKNGYNAIALGAIPYSRERKNRKYQYVKEFFVEDPSQYKLGQTLSLNDLGELKEVSITAFSKGKGFQGPVKRWNFRTARKTHGTKEGRHGSTMNSSITGRTKPGLKMAGRQGGQKTTLNKRKIVLVDLDKNIYAIKGAIPGAADGLVVLRIK